MKISNVLYNNLVNEVIRLKKVVPFKDDLEIIKDVINDYQLYLSDLTLEEQDDLFFQITYSIVNLNR